jgi:hypothetical protein
VTTRRRLLALAGGAAATSLSGCAAVLRNASSSYESGVQVTCSGDAYPDRIAFDCQRFDGETGRLFPVDAGTTIALTCRTDLEAGAVRFLVKGPDDAVRWEHAHDGTDAHEERATVAAETDGRYHVGVEAEDVEGAFEIRWELRE